MRLARHVLDADARLQVEVARDLLDASGSATLTRPMVLLLAQGMRARAARSVRGAAPGRPAIAPIDSTAYVPPPRGGFEPQKIRAMRRARLLAISLAVVGVLAVAAAVWMVLSAGA